MEKRYLSAFSVYICICTEEKEILDFLDEFYYFREEPLNDTKFTCFYNIVSECGAYVTEFEGHQTKVSRKNIYAHINNTIINQLAQVEAENAICLHASAFVDRRRIFILMNGSGAGKTTLTAYCLKYNKKQIKYLADDIVRIDCSQRVIYGLPCGQRIKKGSYELYFAEDGLREYHEEEGEIYIYKPQNAVQDCIPMEDADHIYLINVRYQPDVGMQIKSLGGTKKIESLLNNTYNIKDNAKSIIRNMSLFATFSYYEAIYSDTDKMMKTILVLP